MGRSLTGATKGSQTLSYTYTPDGIRSSKTVNGTKTEYLLNGTQILAQKTGSDVMWFFYDSTGTRIGVQQGNVTAYYMYNLQGDVVGLADAATGKIIAKYLYDAWGKCVSVENADGYTIGTANPFRYRGYYYDNETGFYYLNSRYYNPEVGRFLNADIFVSTDIIGVLNANMFSYCKSNPVCNIDIDGRYTFLCRELDRERQAKEKYTEQTVNIYVSGQGAPDKTKVNVCLYETENSSNMNMSVDKSKEIKSTEEINAVIDVIIDSEYYDKSEYGSKSFMRGQWLAHNMCYELAVSGEVGLSIAQFIAGNEDVIASSESLDLRPLDNFTKRGRVIYTILGFMS